MTQLKSNQAVLSSQGDFSVFRFGKHVIRFRTSPRLERYTSVREWDHGYLVVMAKYKNIPQEEEEYIDLIPILKNLHFDPEKALSSIEKVSIDYEQ